MLTIIGSKNYLDKIKNLKTYLKGRSNTKTAIVLKSLACVSGSFQKNNHFSFIQVIVTFGTFL